MNAKPHDDVVPPVPMTTLFVTHDGPESMVPPLDPPLDEPPLLLVAFDPLLLLADDVDPLDVELDAPPSPAPVESPPPVHATTSASTNAAATILISSF